MLFRNFLFQFNFLFFCDSSCTVKHLIGCPILAVRVPVLFPVLSILSVADWAAMQLVLDIEVVTETARIDLRYIYVLCYYFKDVSTF